MSCCDKQGISSCQCTEHARKLIIIDMGNVPTMHHHTAGPADSDLIQTSEYTGTCLSVGFTWLSGMVPMQVRALYLSIYAIMHQSEMTAASVPDVHPVLCAALQPTDLQLVRRLWPQC